MPKTKSTARRRAPAKAKDAVPYRERLDELLQILVKQGSLGVLLIDLSQLTQVEVAYGSSAFQKVLDSATDLIIDLRGTEVRSKDLLATSDRGGDAFLVFLSPRRAGGTAHIADLQAAASRIEDYLNRTLTGLASPYLNGQLNVTVGFGLVLHNPLVMPERLVARLVQDAWESVRFQHLQRRFRNRSRLQEIVLNNEIRTFFQPIVNMREKSIVGYEALTRGPEGTPLQSPLSLFDVAAESELVFELDRLCRRRALTFSGGLPSAVKVFINLMPSSMYDPDFQGNGFLRELDELGLRPQQIVFELTEKYAIENYSLFGEAMRNLTRLGFSIAVDDIGAGHSGLEKIANLQPDYLKFDIDLTRKIDESYVRREMVRALKTLADKMGSVVIAEGIERPAERDILLDLGITIGQGYLLGRPAPSLRDLLESSGFKLEKPDLAHQQVKTSPGASAAG